MKDYSRFITGFITGYTIEKDKIIVNIPNSKGIIPTYDATPENIQRFKNR